MRRVDAAQEGATESHGFEVVGVPQETLERARAEAARAEKPFDAEQWLSAQKPRRAIRKPYTIKESADLAAGMLRKQGGWLAVRVAEILMAPK